MPLPIRIRGLRSGSPVAIETIFENQLAVADDERAVQPRALLPGLIRKPLERLHETERESEQKEDDVSEFASQLQDWYQSEIAGKAFFDTLADGAQSDDEANKWSLLARLEATMAERLSAACAAASIALPEPSGSRYLDIARELAGKPWRSIMEIVMPQLRTAVSEIRTATQQAPAAHAQIAGEFLAHEEALAAFVSAELKGEDGSPAVQSLLRQWS